MTNLRAHDDLEAILSEVTPEDGAVSHAVGSAFDAVFTWDYGKGQRPALDKLYEKAKVSQWNGATDLDWSIDVDPERTAVELSARDHRVQYVRTDYFFNDPNLGPVRLYLWNPYFIDAGVT